MSEERQYVALICGGRGEDTWDKEVTFKAPNLVTAAAMAHAAAEEAGSGEITGAAVVSVEEVE